MARELRWLFSGAQYFLCSRVYQSHTLLISNSSLCMLQHSILAKVLVHALDKHCRYHELVAKIRPDRQIQALSFKGAMSNVVYRIVSVIEKASTLTSHIVVQRSINIEVQKRLRSTSVYPKETSASSSQSHTPCGSSHLRPTIVCRARRTYPLIHLATHYERHRLFKAAHIDVQHQSILCLNQIYQSLLQSVDQYSDRHEHEGISFPPSIFQASYNK